MSEFAERLKKLMHHYDLGPAELARRLHIQKSAVSHLLTGRNKPRFDILARFADSFPQLNLRWLLTGEGEMLLSPTPPARSGDSAGEDLPCHPTVYVPVQVPASESTPDDQKPRHDASSHNAIPPTDRNESPQKQLNAPDNTGLPQTASGEQIEQIIQVFGDGTFRILRRR